MGFGATILTKNIKDYSNNYDFKYCQEEFAQYLYELAEKTDNDTTSLYIDDENGNLYPEWEIAREFLEDCVRYLEKQNPQKTAFKSNDNEIKYTNKHILETFKGWLEVTSKKENFTHPDWIYVEWL